MKFLHTYILMIICILIVSCNDLIDQKQISDSPSNPSTTIMWFDSVLNLGKVKMGDTVDFAFRFKNSGNNALIINKVESSCSCTSVEMPNKMIAQNDSGSIKAVFETQKSNTGYVQKSLVITSNAIPHIKRLIYFMEITGHKTSTGSEKKAKE